MLGRALSRDPSGHRAEAYLPVAYDGTGIRPDSTTEYGGNKAFPWMYTTAARGVHATPETWGRGLLAVSNKISEHNIYNLAPRLTVNYLPPNKTNQMSWRITSRTMAKPGG